MCWHRGFEFAVSFYDGCSNVYSSFLLEVMILFAQWEESGLLAQSCQAFGWRWSQFGASQRFRISDEMGSTHHSSPPMWSLPRNCPRDQLWTRERLYLRTPSGHDPCPSHHICSEHLLISYRLALFCSGARPVSLANIYLTALGVGGGMQDCRSSCSVGDL